MTKVKEQALQKVKDFLIAQGSHDEIIVLDIAQRHDKHDVMLLKPYGLFIVHPDGRAGDNYQVFEED